MTRRKRRGNRETADRVSSKRSLFLKYYLNSEIDGKVNPYFSNAKKSALKVGYSESYATKILSRMEKQSNPEGEKVVKVRKGLKEALEEQGVNTDWLGKLVYRLGDKNDKRIINKKLVDTGDPDSQGARIALDFIAKTQGLYEPEQHNHKYDGLSKEELIELIVRGIAGKDRA